jgi:hypothetical protein
MCFQFRIKVVKLIAILVRFPQDGPWELAAQKVPKCERLEYRILKLIPQRKAETTPARQGSH